MQPIKEEQKPKKIGFLQSFHPKNISKGWQVTKQNPYFAAKFYYRIALILLGAVALSVGYLIFKIIIGYNGGSGYMTLIGRGLLALIGVVFAIKCFSLLKPMKARIKYYEDNPKTINSYQGQDVRQEIDELLKQFEEKDKMKGGQNE